jgi:hypothetical protein
MTEQHYQSLTDDKFLLPLLPGYRDYRSGRLHFDYYCPGPCLGTCKHQRLTVAQAHEQCKEDYARTGRQTCLDQALEYLEFMITVELPRVQ